MLPTTNIPTLLETLRAKINETHWIGGVKEVVDSLISVVEKQEQELIVLRGLLNNVLNKNEDLPAKKTAQSLMSHEEVLKEIDRLHKDQASEVWKQQETFQSDTFQTLKQREAFRTQEQMKYTFRVFDPNAPLTFDHSPDIEEAENLKKFRAEAYHSKASLLQFRLLHYDPPYPCQSFTATPGKHYSHSVDYSANCFNCGHSYVTHTRLGKGRLAWSDHDFVAIVFDPLRIVAVGSSRVRTKEAAVSVGHLTPLILPGDKVSKALAEFIK